jgi:hypothetical protein
MSVFAFCSLGYLDEVTVALYLHVLRVESAGLARA